MAADLPTIRTALDEEWAEFMVPVNSQGKRTVAETWRVQNPGEWQKLQDYRAGSGARPVLVTSFGRQMVEHVDAYLLTGTVEPPPPPPPPPAGDWAIPKPRGRKVVGQSNPPFQEDTWYEDCTGLSIPNGAKHFTVIGSSGGLWTTNKGWTDFWIGGRPDRLWSVGPRTDGGDFLQIKRSNYDDKGGVLPADGVYAFIEFHDISRPAGSAAHPDCIQMMAGTRLTIGGCRFRNTGEAVQPIFLNDAGYAAWGGPLTDIVVDGCKFENVTHFYSMRGGSILGTLTVRNCDLGGKNAAITDNCVVVWENNTNGTLIRPKPS